MREAGLYCLRWKTNSHSYSSRRLVVTRPIVWRERRSPNREFLPYCPRRRSVCSSVLEQCICLTFLAAHLKRRSDSRRNRDNCRLPSSAPILRPGRWAQKFPAAASHKNKRGILQAMLEESIFSCFPNAKLTGCCAENSGLREEPS
jgi:hypothetical protein